MNGVVAHRTEFCEPILPMLEAAYAEFGELTGRHYGLLSQYRVRRRRDRLRLARLGRREHRGRRRPPARAKGEKVGSIHVNVLRPMPEAAYVAALAGQEERHRDGADRPAAGGRQPAGARHPHRLHEGRPGRDDRGRPPCRASSPASTASARATSGPRASSAPTGSRPASLARKDGHTEADGTTLFVVGIDHPYEVKAAERPSLLPHGAIAVRLHSIGGWGMITTGKNLGEIIGELGDHVAERDGAVDELRAAEGGRPRLREPEVRVGEEGRADRVLPRRRPGADPGQLRPAARDRRPLLRPEGLHAHEPARRHGRGRRLRLGVGREPRDGLDADPAEVPAGDPRQEDPPLHPARLRHRARRHRAPRPAAAHAGQRLPRRVLRRLALPRGVRDRPRPLQRAGREAVPEEVRPLRRRRRRLEHGGHAPGLLAGEGDRLRRRGRARPLEHAGRVALPARRVRDDVPRRARSRPPRRSGRPSSGARRFDREFRAGLGYHQPASVLAAAGVDGGGDRRRRRRSTSRGGRRPSSSPRTARSAWTASRRAPTRRCPTRRRTSRRS